LLAEIARAQVETNYRAKRQRTQRDLDREATTSRFEERVFHRAPGPDGEPERHLVELLEVAEGSQAPNDWKPGQFEELSLSHRLRSSFIERYRELRFGRPEQILANYELRVRKEGRLLERDCLLLELSSRRRSDAQGLGRGIYEVWVDASTKLPLQTREYALEGGERRLVAESLLLELEPLGDEAGIPWPKVDVRREQLGDDELPDFLAGREVGFPPVVAGFERVRRERVHAPTMGDFVLHFCSDGLDPLLFLQGLPENPARLETSEGRGRELVPLEILEVEFGRTIALITAYDGVSTYLIGKGDRQTLRGIFEQLFRS
jgi:hypothetical protein